MQPTIMPHVPNLQSAIPSSSTTDYYSNSYYNSDNTNCSSRMSTFFTDEFKRKASSKPTGYFCGDIASSPPGITASITTGTGSSTGSYEYLGRATTTTGSSSSSNEHFCLSAPPQVSATSLSSLSTDSYTIAPIDTQTQTHHIGSFINDHNKQTELQEHETTQSSLCNPTPHNKQSINTIDSHHTPNLLFERNTTSLLPAPTTTTSSSRMSETYHFRAPIPNSGASTIARQAGNTNTAPTISSFPSLNHPSNQNITQEQHPGSTLSSEPSSFLRARLHALQQKQQKSFQNYGETAASSYDTPHSADSHLQRPLMPRQTELFNTNNSTHQTMTTNDFVSLSGNRPPYQMSQHYVPPNNSLITRGGTVRSVSLDSSTTTTTTVPTESDPHSNKNKTRLKLFALQDKIVKFEGQLQAESQHRKAAEENRLNVLREAVNGLEKALQAEIRRRLESNKTIQSEFESQLTTLEAHVDQTMTERGRRITEAVEALSSRIQTAEAQMASERQNHIIAIEKIESDIQATVQEIQTIKEHLDNELKARKQREAVMLDRLTDIEKQVDSRLTIERGMRQKDIDSLRNSLEAVHDNHVALDEAFQQNLAAEFHELKLGLQAECQAREQADDDIVQALNHYTAALQSALRIANSA